MAGNEYTITKIMRNGTEYLLAGAQKKLPKKIFGTGCDGDCTIEYDESTCGNIFREAKEYNFNNLTICPNVKLRFCGQGVPIIRVKECFLNQGTIDLHNPLLNTNINYTEPYSGKTIKACCNAYYSTANSLYNSLISRCTTLRNCLTLEKLSGQSAGGGASGARCSCQSNTCSSAGGRGGQGGQGGGQGGTGYTSFSPCYKQPGASGGTSSYDNAGGGGGGGGYVLCAEKNCFQTVKGEKNAQAGGAAADGIGGKGGDGGAVIFCRGDYYSQCGAGCYIVGGSGGGGGYGYCQGGNGGDGMGAHNYYVCSSSTCYVSGNSGNGGNGGNSYLGNAGNGGGVYCLSCADGTTKVAGYNGDDTAGQPGNGGCSYYGNGGNIGNARYLRYRKGGCSIYGNGGGFNDTVSLDVYVFQQTCGGDTIYGRGGSICAARVQGGYGGWSIYGDGGVIYSSCGYASTSGAGGSTMFGTGGSGSGGCYCASSPSGGDSLYGNGGSASGCGTGGNGIDGGTGSQKCKYGIAWEGMYGIGIFSKNILNSGIINGRGGLGRNCTKGADIYIGYSDSYCNTGIICVVGCSSACNGTATILQ